MNRVAKEGSTTWARERLAVLSEGELGWSITIVRQRGGGVGGDEKAKVRRGLYLLGGGLASITETNNRSKVDSFLFPIEIQLEVWGAAPLLHEVTQGPRFLSACCSKEMFFFHVTKTDLSPPHTTSHLVAKGKRTRGSGLLRT